MFPTILADGFRSYGSVVARRLIVLGVFYVIAMALVLAGSALADGGMLLKVMLGAAGAMDPEAMANSRYAAGRGHGLRVLHSGGHAFLVLADSCCPA